MMQESDVTQPKLANRLDFQYSFPLMKDYDPAKIEPKWQAFWETKETFKVGNPGPKKLYCLDMFPYPSGSGLHIGHPLGYTATDIYSRFKRMCGFSVLHPMGFDAFGLPAEQHAVNTGEHPANITKKNCEVFTRQMKTIGFSYDWSRSLATCDPEYYRWTQWIFLKIYNSYFDHKEQRAKPISELPIPPEVKKAGEKAIYDFQAKHRLAYNDDFTVNWCPGLGTVLANEEVIDGKSERGGFDVVRKPMKQWALRITEYTERLLSELEEIDWPESIKEQQRNWIGKKHGAEITFKIAESSKAFVAFTTRPDTLFGVTFFVISPEHPLLSEVTKPAYSQKVKDYCDHAKRMSELMRTVENRTKTGVFTGSYVVNPITSETVPVYVGDYVLMSYGTGAVMGVPAHDDRDFEFARTFQIEIRPLIVPEGENEEVRAAVKDGEMAWTGSGRMLPCSFSNALALGLDNRTNKEAGELICGWLERHHLGKKVITYKLRDWVFSRQRYWGEPIPIIHWEDGTASSIPESELPLVLPEVKDYKPNESGESALSKAENWVNVEEKKTGRKGKRETNTMPQWAGSCWYYLRFIDPHNDKAPWDKKLESSWMPIDLYVGGAEHAVLHLLYARFWHKVLFDLGFVSTREPFKRLFNQGMILAYAYQDQRGALVASDEVEEKENGSFVHKKTGQSLERIVAKMSKSLKNVINPDDIIKEYGADTLRTYLMFRGPLDSSGPWDSRAISGSFRFLKRAFSFVTGNTESGHREVVGTEAESANVKRAINFAVKKLGEDYDTLSFNTAVSTLMEFLNTVGQEPVTKDTLEKFCLILSPLAPHLAEELWTRLGHNQTLAYQAWPIFDPAYLKNDRVSVVVQVNGKKRALVDVAVDIDENELKQIVIAALSKTSHQASPGDRFITVYKHGTKEPKLVNVIASSE